MLSHSRRHKTTSGLVSSDGEGERNGGKTQGGSEGERNGEPAQASEDVSLPGRLGGGGNGRLPVGLVDENGSEVAHNVGEAEEKTVTRKHGEVGTVVVLLNGVDGDNRGEVLPDLARGTEIARGDVDLEHEDAKGDKDHRGVEVGRDESGLQTTSHRVQNDTKGNEHRGNILRHAGKGIDGGGTTENEHGSNNNVCHEGENGENQMGDSAPPCTDDLKEGMGFRGTTLDVDGQDGEQKNLNRGTRGVPEPVQRVKIKVCPVSAAVNGKQRKEDENPE